LKNKLKLWQKNLTAVTPSRWLAGCAGESRLLGRFRVESIANSLETDVFAPVPRLEARERLNIDPGTTVILYGSLFHVRKRKGFPQFIDSIRCCLKKRTFRRAVARGKVRFITVGETFGSLPELPFPLVSYGKVDDDGLLSLIYSAADLFVLPSLEDNLPNTMLEAMACGTPVVAFDVGGIPEVVRNGENGCVVPRGDVQKMGQCIMSLVFDGKRRQHLGDNAASLMAREFHLGIQAGRYLDLFKDLTGRQNPGPDDRVSPIESQEPPREIELQDIKQEIDPDFLANLRELKKFIYTES
jgi:glycosyltransferase involved in cell wall biosynthesis